MVEITLTRRGCPVRPRSPFQDACDCAHCGLYKPKNGFMPVAGSGNHNAHLIFVGEAPGATEVAIGEPFVGESGRLLDHALEEVGLSRSDVYCTNAVLCRPDGNRDPSKAEIVACNTRLKQEILSLPERHVIVILGTPAVKAVVGRNDGITSMLFRTEWNSAYQCFILYCYHPAACLREADYFQDVLFTLRKAKDFLGVAKGPFPSPQVTYVLEQDAGQACERLDKLRTQASEYISCDIETAQRESEAGSLDWRTGRITQLGFGFTWNGRDQAYLLPAAILEDHRVRDAVNRLLARRDVRWIWHNGKFDATFLRNHGIHPHIDIDTMLMSKSLDERNRVHGLKQLGARYYGDYDWGEEKDGFTDPVYHAKDCVYTLRLGRDTLPAELARETPSRQGYHGPLYRHNTILIPVWNIFVKTERHGVRIDRVRLEKLERDTAQELAEREKQCQQLAGITFPTEHNVYHIENLPPTYNKRTGKPNKPRTHRVKDIIVEQVPLNIQSPKQLGYFLFDHLRLPVLKYTETGQRSVDEEVLKALQNRHPFIKTLLGYRLIQKQYSTYIMGALKESKVTGRIHTHFAFNPVSGRLSSSDLNIQNLPKESPIRSMYIADEGYNFLEFDYSNQEVRMAAFYSKSKALLEACKQADFHTSIARNVFKVRYDEIDTCGDDLVALERVLVKHSDYRQIANDHAHTPYTAKELKKRLYDHLRKAAKAITFGIIYGESPAGLQETLEKKNGIVISLAEAAAYRNGWLGSYPELDRWLRERCAEILTYGFVDTPTGHRRRKYLITDSTAGEAQRQAMNSPIQGLSADMTLLAVIAIDKLLTETGWGELLFFVHDSIDLQIKKEHVEEAVPRIKYSMEHALDPYQDKDFYVPFPVDIKIGRGWGAENMHTLEI